MTDLAFSIQNSSLGWFGRTWILACPILSIGRLWGKIGTLPNLRGSRPTGRGASLLGRWVLLSPVSSLRAKQVFLAGEFSWPSFNPEISEHLCTEKAYRTKLGCVMKVCPSSHSKFQLTMMELGFLAIRLVQTALIWQTAIDTTTGHMSGPARVNLVLGRASNLLSTRFLNTGLISRRAVRIFLR